MVVEVLEDNVSGVLVLTDSDIAKIGLFEKGVTFFGDEDYIRGLVEKAQKANSFSELVCMRMVGNRNMALRLEAPSA